MPVTATVSQQHQHSHFAKEACPVLCHSSSATPLQGHRPDGALAVEEAVAKRVAPRLSSSVKWCPDQTPALPGGQDHPS